MRREACRDRRRSDDVVLVRHEESLRGELHPLAAVHLNAVQYLRESKQNVMNPDLYKNGLTMKPVRNWEAFIHNSVVSRMRGCVELVLLTRITCSLESILLSS